MLQFKISIIHRVQFIYTLLYMIVSSNNKHFDISIFI